MGAGKPLASLSVDEKNLMYAEAAPGVGPGEAKITAVCKKSAR